jgi:hypothetical protein
MFAVLLHGSTARDAHLHIAVCNVVQSIKLRVINTLVHGEINGWNT